MGALLCCASARSRPDEVAEPMSVLRLPFFFAVLALAVEELAPCCEPELRAVRFSSGSLHVAAAAGDRSLVLRVGACGSGYDGCSGFAAVDGVHATVDGSHVQFKGKVAPAAACEEGDDPAALCQVAALVAPLALSVPAGAVVQQVAPGGVGTEVEAAVGRLCTVRSGRQTEPSFAASPRLLVVLGEADGIQSQSSGVETRLQCGEHDSAVQIRRIEVDSVRALTGLECAFTTAPVPATARANIVVERAASRWHDHERQMEIDRARLLVAGVSGAKRGPAEVRCGDRGNYRVVIATVSTVPNLADTLVGVTVAQAPDEDEEVEPGIITSRFAARARPPGLRYAGVTYDPAFSVCFGDLAENRCTQFAAHLAQGETVRLPHLHLTYPLGFRVLHVVTLRTALAVDDPAGCRIVQPPGGTEVPDTSNVRLTGRVLGPRGGAAAAAMDERAVAVLVAGQRVVTALVDSGGASERVSVLSGGQAQPPHLELVDSTLQAQYFGDGEASLDAVVELCAPLSDDEARLVAAGTCTLVQASRGLQGRPELQELAITAASSLLSPAARDDLTLARAAAELLPRLRLPGARQALLAARAGGQQHVPLFDLRLQPVLDPLHCMLNLLKLMSACTHAHTHACTGRITHTHTHTHSRTHSRTLSRTRSRTHTRARTHAHTRTHIANTHAHTPRTSTQEHPFLS